MRKVKCEVCNSNSSLPPDYCTKNVCSDCCDDGKCPYRGDCEYWHIRESVDAFLKDDRARNYLIQKMSEIVKKDLLKSLLIMTTSGLTPSLVPVLLLYHSRRTESVEDSIDLINTLKKLEQLSNIVNNEYAEALEYAAEVIKRSALKVEVKCENLDCIHRSTGYCRAGQIEIDENGTCLTKRRC